jgi:hypothetical protein
MKDQLKRLENLLRGLSRLPGLGFLADQADSLLRSVDTFDNTFIEPIEEQIFAVDSAKQAVQDFGRGTASDLRGRPSDESADSRDEPESGGDGRSGPRADGGKGEKPLASAPASKPRQQSRADLRLQKKLLTRKLRG